MRRLWLLFRRILRAVIGREPSSTSDSTSRGRQVDDYVQLLDRSGGTRITTVRLLGGRATDDNVISLREHIETEDQNGILRQVDVYVGQRCSCGRVIDQETHLAGSCRICGAILCSGCLDCCCICGAACCPIHLKTYDLGNGKTTTFCIRCSWRHWWRKWWGLYP